MVFARPDRMPQRQLRLPRKRLSSSASHFASHDGEKLVKRTSNDPGAFSAEHNHKRPAAGAASQTRRPSLRREKLRKRRPSPQTFCQRLDAAASLRSGRTDGGSEEAALLTVGGKSSACLHRTGTAALRRSGCATFTDWSLGRSSETTRRCRGAAAAAAQSAEGSPSQSH